MNRSSTQTPSATVLTSDSIPASLKGVETPTRHAATRIGPQIVGVPGRAAFVRRNCSGSPSIFFANMSSTLSTAKPEIGEPARAAVLSAAGSRSAWCG
jgi:hypothetical protein